MKKISTVLLTIMVVMGLVAFQPSTLLAGHGTANALTKGQGQKKGLLKTHKGKRLGHTKHLPETTVTE